MGKVTSLSVGNSAWICLVAVYILVTVLGVDAWRRGPFVGFTIHEQSDGKFVANVETAGRAWEAGVRDGDTLVSVDGADAGNHSETALKDPNAEVIFRSASTGELIPARPDDGLPDKPNPIGVVIAGGVFGILGIFAYARPTRSRHATVLSWLTLTFAIGFAASAGALVWHTPTNAVLSVIMYWIPVLLLATVLLFAASDSRAVGLGWRRWLLPTTLIAGLLQAMYVVSLVWLPDLYEPARMTRFGFLAAGFMLAPVLLVFIYRRASLPVVKEQARIVFVGAAVGLLPFGVLVLIPSVFAQPSVVRPDFAALAFLLIPVAFVYAILRHELMGIRRLVHRGVAYAMMSVVAITVYVGGVIVARAWSTEPTDSAYAVSGVVLLAVVGGLPLISRVRDESFGLVDRILYREFDDRAGLLRRVSLEAVQATDVDSLIESTLSAVSQALDLEFAGYYEVAAGNVYSEIRVGRLSEKATTAIESLEICADSPFDQVTFTENGRTRTAITCRVAFSDESSSRSHLYFGPKVSDEPLQDSDRQMIEVVCDLVVTAGSRLRLVDQLQSLNTELIDANVKLVETEEKERASVSAYLHDQPLQKVTYVMGQYKERGLSSDLTEVLNDVADELRATSLKLSPAFITDLGLIPTLEWLVDETRTRRKFHVGLNFDNFDRHERLDPNIELSIYRLVQESLTNCEKHSSASNVNVALGHSSDSVTVSVEDDGVGVPFLMSDNGTPNPRIESLGIRTMMYRIQGHGGEFRVENLSAGGTRVVARIPV